MRSVLLLILLFALLAVAGCSGTTTQPAVNAPQTSGSSPAPSATAGDAAGVSSTAVGSPVAANATIVKPKIDACALLTSKDIEAVQGEALKETKLSGQATGGFLMSQCFFTLPTFTNSVSLLVAQRGEGSDAKDPKEFFHDRFDEKRAGESERERDKKKGEAEEGEGTPPQKISGIGDEAYWTGSRVGGALYVLKGNTYVRISIGGPAEQAAKIRKTKALAAKVLARL
jgi:hypothetical protein